MGNAPACCVSTYKVWGDVVTLNNTARVSGENSLDRYKEALKVFESEFTFHMSVIMEEILKQVKPVSIYLIGSFGRNEGALYFSGKHVRPLRDYDILIVVDSYLKFGVIKRIRRSIHKRLGLSDLYSRKFRFKGFAVWVTQVMLKDINQWPLLKYYELKKSSKLLWGKDIRGNIHIDFKDLSAYNGILILFSKAQGLLGLLDVSTLKQNRYSEKMIDFVYECMKTYVEFCTCLCLLARVYEPSFLKRCAKVSENFDLLFPELKRMTDTLQQSMLSYSYKRLLFEDRELNDLDLMKLLIGTLKHLKIVIWYYIHEAYEANINHNPLSPMVFDDYVKKLNTTVLKDLFDHFIKAKVGFSSKVIRELAIRFYLRYTLLQIFIRGRKAGYPIKPSILFSRNGNLMLRLWAINFMLLDSIEDDSRIDENALDMVSDKLCETIDRNFIEMNSLKEKRESRFSALQKIVLDLLELTDGVFHRKD